MTGRTVIFQNPASGTSNHETRSRVRDLLAGDGDTVEEVIVNPGMTLLERASQVVKDGAELVVAAGGDGTVREIASALVDTEATLGIVPLGTFNNLARSLNLPSDPDAACGLIQRGLTRKIDVGIADDRHYFFEVCPGAILDDGLFSISVFRDFSKFELIWHFWSISRGHRQYHPKLEMFEGKEFEISSCKP